MEFSTALLLALLWMSAGVAAEEAWRRGINAKLAFRTMPIYSDIVLAALILGPFGALSFAVAYVVTAHRLRGLTDREAMEACGPAVFMVFREYHGRNPTTFEAEELARVTGWTNGSAA